MSDTCRHEEQADDGTQAWQARAALLELLALSFAYPDERLSEALASGEYATALDELASFNGLTSALEHELAATQAGVGNVDKPADMDGAIAASGTSDANDACGAGGSADTYGATCLRVYEGMDPEVLRHRLGAEHTRLFIGAPEPVVSPYEGVWRAEDEGVPPLLMVNPHTMDVERFYHSCGLGKPEGTNEPLDHISTELEFMQYLASVRAGIVEPVADIEEGAQAAFQQFSHEHFALWSDRFGRAARCESREPLFQLTGALLATLCSSIAGAQ